MTSDPRRLVALLERAGLERVKSSGLNHLIAVCPYHAWRNGLSFAINTSTGLFCCYSAECAVAGPLTKLLEDLLGLSKRQAQEEADNLVRPVFTEEAISTLRERIDKLATRRGIKVAPEPGITERALFRFDKCPGYMLDRKFPKAVLKQFEIGFDDAGLAVTLPVRKPDGELVGISKRQLYAEPKYLHLHFQKGQILYGEHIYPPSTVDEIWVGEGQADALALVAFGKSAVSTMGNMVSRSQIDRLAAYRRVVLAFDDDQGGRTATRHVGLTLARKMLQGRVRVANAFGDFKDPAELLECGSKERKKAFLETRPKLFSRWLMELDSANQHA